MPTSPIGRAVPGPLRWMLWLSVAISAGALAASIAGLVDPTTYAKETTNWAAQAVGQDVVNLIVYPLMVLLAWLAVRRSLGAYLAWIGIAAYSAYSYLLYAGWVHFSGWFMVYVLTFGLSVYALVMGATSVDPTRLSRAFVTTVPNRAVGTVLVVLGGLFSMLWLSEIVRPTIAGTVPEPIVVAGLPSNPVWVLDLGVVLPAMILAGVLLRRERPVGFLLAVPLLTFGVAMGTAIVGMFGALWLRDEPVAAAPALMIVLVVIGEAIALRTMLRHLRHDAHPVDVLRPTGGDRRMTERVRGRTSGSRAPVE